MILVEDGVLGLNRPVTEFLPEMRCGSRVTAFHLLTHTSGLPTVDWSKIDGGTGFPPTARLQRMVEFCCTLEPHFAPGTQHSYSGVNYLLLGEIVARLAGCPLGILLAERIFQPLGMTSTSLGLAPGQRARRVRPDPAIYAKFPNYDPNDLTRLSIPHPAGGLFSTALDVWAFCQLFAEGGRWRGGQILSPATVRAMTTNQIPGIGARDGQRWVTEASWGLGWMVQAPSPWMYAHGSLQAPGTYYHQGASGVGMWVDPTNGVVGVYLSVLRRIEPRTEHFEWDFDLFQNMVSAAITA
jgi:CubicO group peptidase (beta-lactamase class C family)